MAVKTITIDVEAYERGLARGGEPLPTMDLLIAATALTQGAALLTANEAHFARVAGLRVLGYR